MIAGKSSLAAPSDRLRPGVLIVDDDESARFRMKAILQDLVQADEVALFECASIPEALTLIALNPIRVILLDKDLGDSTDDPKQNGILSIPDMLGIRPEVQIVMVTGSRDAQDVLNAYDKGATGYVLKEMEDEIIARQIRIAIRSAEIELQREYASRTKKSDDDFDLVGKSPAIKQVRHQAQVFGETEYPVLILGESGTGKTTVAKAIHDHRTKVLKETSSQRRPFVSISLAGLHLETIESELFGHEKGSFTGATQARRGLVELANGGTLFLDEIADVPLSVQAKLLKVLEEGIYYRVGSSTPMHSSFKLICATHKSLKLMIERGEFRHDLFMRLSVLSFEMPGLKERPEDVPEVVKSLLPRIGEKTHTRFTYDDIPMDLIAWLQDHIPEGNIRGIEHLLARVVTLSRDKNTGTVNLKPWKHHLRVNEDVPARCSSRKILTYAELRDLPFDLADSDFPGLTKFTSLMSFKAVQSARQAHRTSAEAALFLDVSEGTVSLKLRRHGEPPAGARLAKQNPAEE